MANDNAGKKPKKRGPGRPFQKGTVPNPKGRPKGARSKLAENFLDALLHDFEENGISAIVAMRIEKPDAYINAVVKVVQTKFQMMDEEGNDAPLEREMVIKLVPSQNKFAGNG